MGNATSVPNNKNSKNTNKVIINTSEQIFEKILNISNDIIVKYNNNFLEQKFCDSISLIYQNKLKELDIKVLRNINSNINNSKSNKELRLLLQYNPKNDDKFFADSFKMKLEELFYNKNIEYSKNVFNNSNLPDNFDKIMSYIKYKPKYINYYHVNKILDSVIAQKKQNGGDFGIELDKELKKLNNNNEIYQKNNSNKYKKNIIKVNNKKNNQKNNFEN